MIICFYFFLLVYLLFSTAAAQTPGKGGKKDSLPTPVESVGRHFRHFNHQKTTVII